MGMETVYFEGMDGYYRELREDYPARRSGETTPFSLGQAVVGEEIEVFLGSGWVEGSRRETPTTFGFEVSCVSFLPEREVWKALEGALRHLSTETDSPIPWLKVIPPSRQPGSK